MLKNQYKVILSMLIFIILSFASVYAADVDKVPPSIMMMYKSEKEVRNGDTVEFSVSYSDNVKIKDINLSANSIKLNGFKADIEIKTVEANKRLIVLSKISGSVGANKYISICDGTATDDAGNKSPGIERSIYFKIVDSNDTQNPEMTISSPSEKSVYNGNSLEYTVAYEDNVGIDQILLNSRNISLNGFTANISISGSGNTRIIKLSNINGEISKNNSITISSGSALDKAGNKAYGISMSEEFSIVEKTSTATGEKIDVPNEEVKNEGSEEFAKFDCQTPISMEVDNSYKKLDLYLTVKRDGIKNIVDNNFTAANIECTYILDYFNSTDAEINGATLILNIPKNVIITEISANGKMIYNSNTLTKIKWNIGNVPSNSGHELIVKVKFKPDNNIIKSDMLYKEFITKADLKYADTTITKSIRQIYIDNKSNKTDKNNSFLKIYLFNFLANPNQKITKIDFARLILDSGIVEKVPNSDKYKIYSDNEEFKVNQRKAISTLTEIGIFSPDKDGKLNINKVLNQEEMYGYISRIMEYKYFGLTVSADSVFVKTQLLNVENKDTVNSLMLLDSLNIVSLDKINLKKEVTLRDVLEVICNITYKTDIENKGKIIFFKNKNFKQNDEYLSLISMNSFKYTYNDKLNIEIK